jgi:flagellar biosynthesis/type III secretory pathway chaperone
MSKPKPDGLHWPDTLLNLLDRQQSLTQRLSSLADAQTALISSRQTDALLGLLGQRQQIVDELVASQDELAGLMVDLNDRLAAAPAATRDRIRAQVAVISQALETVSRRDEHDQRVLQAGCEQVKVELASLDAAATARDAYVNSGRTGRVVNRFADRTG